MTTSKRIEHHGTRVLRRYSEIGAWLGGVFAVIVAVIVSGQQRENWQLTTHLIAISASLIAGAIVGYLAGYIASPGGSGIESYQEGENNDGGDAP